MTYQQTNYLMAGLPSHIDTCNSKDTWVATLEGELRGGEKMFLVILLTPRKVVKYNSLTPMFKETDLSTYH